MPPGMMPMMPPMMFMPSGKQRSFGRAIFSTLATTVLFLSLLINFYFLVIESAFSSGRGPQEIVVAGGASDEKIVVLPVEGLVSGPMVAEMERFLKLAEGDAKVKAVVVHVETPGGTVAASDEIYHRLVRFKEGRRLPLVVSMGSIATSGGYYISCAGDQIIASRSTLTGNIGVIFPRLNVSAMTERWGIVENTLTAPRDGYKNAGSPFQKPATRDSEYLQGLISQAYEQFKGVVAKSRGNKVKINEVADGRIMSAEEAKQSGLVDQIGYLNDAVAAAASSAGLRNPTVVRYQPVPSFWAALMGSSGDQDKAAPVGSMNVSGVKVEVNSRLLEELTTPRMMYLWRGN